jgi:hypothetical protein
LGEAAPQISIRNQELRKKPGMAAKILKYPILVPPRFRIIYFILS